MTSPRRSHRRADEKDAVRLHRTEATSIAPNRSLVLAAGICLAAGAALAQGTRVSTFETNSSITFHQYLEPFPRTPSAEACRDDCVADSRCTGWTWYDRRESNPPQLRGVCIKGVRLKDRRSGDAAGRTAGEIRTP